MNMNDEQRKLAEDNMKLVYYLINKYYPQHNRDDDVIQAGMLGLCYATMKWDATKGSFQTIAGNYILGYIKNHFKQIKPKAKILSLEYEYDDSMTLADVVKGDCDVESMCEVTEFLENETDKTQLILYMFANGFESKEIAEQLGVSRSYVNKVKRITKLKWEGKHNDN